MNKTEADVLALIFARDIVKTSSSSATLPYIYVNQDSANSIADFVETLSNRFLSLDEKVDLMKVINAHKGQ